MSTNTYFSDIPQAPPRLDHAAVEQARLVRVVRDHLATSETSIGYDGLATGRACSQEAARQWVKRHRSKQALITVDYDGGTLIPLFQLDEAFELNPVATQTTAKLLAGGMNSWAVWQWYTAINPWIERRPVSVLDDPELMRQALEGLFGA